jgi:predicted MFS family arabinose efflux permease
LLQVAQPQVPRRHHPGADLGASLGWRNLFLLTGTAGIILSAVILFGVRERGVAKASPSGGSNRPASIASIARKRRLCCASEACSFVRQGFVRVFP